MTLDYRYRAFSVTKLKRTSTHLGQYQYPNIYVVENCLRIIIHTVLTNQLGPDWWFSVASRKLRDSACYTKKKNAERIIRDRRHVKPGGHRIYYTLFTGLLEILNGQAHIFRTYIKRFDEYYVRLEKMVHSRNLVCHSNYPGAFDRRVIKDVAKRTDGILKEIAERGLPLTPPP
jgi:hypothetical protein